MIFSLLLNRRLLADTRVGTFGASVNRRRRIAEDRSRLLPMGVHQAEETSSVHSMKIKVEKVKLATFTKAAESAQKSVEFRRNRVGPDVLFYTYYPTCTEQKDLHCLRTAAGHAHNAELPLSTTAVHPKEQEI